MPRLAARRDILNCLEAQDFFGMCRPQVLLRTSLDASTVTAQGWEGEGVLWLHGFFGAFQGFCLGVSTV